MIRKNKSDIHEIYAIDKGVRIIRMTATQKLGSGSYGVVHMGKHKITGQERAIKSIAKAKIKNMERFKTEVKILQTLVTIQK